MTLALAPPAPLLQAVQSIGNLGQQLGQGKEMWMAPLHPFLLQSISRVRDFLDQLVDVDGEEGEFLWGRRGEDGKRQRISWKGFPGGIGHQLWRKRGLEFTVLFLEEGPNWAGQRGKSSKRLAQLNRDNLTPSELWPQPKPSPTSGRPPFSRVDMRLVSHGMSWGRGSGKTEE